MPRVEDEDDPRVGAFVNDVVLERVVEDEWRGAPLDAFCVGRADAQRRARRGRDRDVRPQPRVRRPAVRQDLRARLQDAELGVEEGARRPDGGQRLREPRRDLRGAHPVTETRSGRQSIPARPATRASGTSPCLSSATSSQPQSSPGAPGRRRARPSACRTTSASARRASSTASSRPNAAVRRASRSSPGSAPAAHSGRAVRLAA